MGLLDFALSMTDKMSAPANAAASSLSALEKQIQSESEALSKLEKSMANVHKGNVVDIEAHKTLTGLIDQKKNSIGNLEASMVNLGGAAQGATGGTMSFKDSLDGLGAVLGPIASALGAVGSVLLGFAVGGAAIAIAASDFKGDMIDAYAAATGMADAGEKTYAAIDALARKMPEAAEKIHGKAKSLLASGLDPDLLEGTLKAASDLAVVMGDEGANKLQSIIERATTEGKFKIDAKKLVGTGVQLPKLIEQIAKNTGKSMLEVEKALKEGTLDAKTGIAELNKAVSEKFSGQAGAQLLDLDIQAVKFQDHVKRLFADVKPDKFLEGLGKVIALFDDTTASGAAMKSIITKAFTGLFDVASKVFPFVQELIEQVIIAGLKMYIRMKPILGLLEKMFATSGDGDLLKLAITGIAYAVEAIIGSFLVAIIVLKTMWDVMSAGASIASDAFDFVSNAASTLWDGVTDLFASGIANISATWETLKSIFSGDTLSTKATEIATNFIDGLVGGITSGIARVVGAVSSLATGALDAAKSVLKSSSPSMAMFDLGVDTGEGYSLGAEKETPKVRGTLEQMVAPPTPVEMAAPSLAPTPLADAAATPIASPASPLTSAAQPPLGLAPDMLAASASNDNGKPSLLDSKAAGMAPIDIAPAAISVAAPVLPPPASIPAPVVDVNAAASTGGKGGNTIHVNAPITIEGSGKSAEQIMTLYEEHVTDIFERVAAQLGGVEAA